MRRTPFLFSILFYVFSVSAFAASFAETLEALKGDGKNPALNEAVARMQVYIGEEKPAYEINPKHIGVGLHDGASELPANAEELFHHSLVVLDGRGRQAWWAADVQDEKCVFHRFQGANQIVHWNGSTNPRSDGSPGIKLKDVPRDIRTIYQINFECR